MLYVCVWEETLLLLLINTAQLYDSYPGHHSSTEQEGVPLILTHTVAGSDMLLSDLERYTAHQGLEMIHRFQLVKLCLWCHSICLPPITYCTRNTYRTGISVHCCLPQWVFWCYHWGGRLCWKCSTSTYSGFKPGFIFIRGTHCDWAVLFVSYTEQGLSSLFVCRAATNNYFLV